jgi:hypothetical protein
VTAGAGASLLDVANRGRALLRKLHLLRRAVAIGRSYLQLRTTRGIDRCLTRRIDAELALDDVQHVSGALSGDCEQRRAAEQPTRQENGRPARAEKPIRGRPGVYKGVVGSSRTNDPGAPPCRGSGAGACWPSAFPGSRELECGCRETVLKKRPRMLRADMLRRGAGSGDGLSRVPGSLYMRIQLSSNGSSNRKTKAPQGAQPRPNSGSKLGGESPPWALRS